VLQAQKKLFRFPTTHNNTEEGAYGKIKKPNPTSFSVGKIRRERKAKHSLSKKRKAIVCVCVCVAGEKPLIIFLAGRASRAFSSISNHLTLTLL
jgi:hypothetical protein